MAQLIIYREKSVFGMISPMDCYVNGLVACKIKNGETITCTVVNAVIGFKCNIHSSPMSDLVYLDLSDGKTVNIKIKNNVSKPSVAIAEKDALVSNMPNNACGFAGSTLQAKPQNDLRSALHTMQQSADFHASSPTFTPTQTVGNLFAIDERARLWAIGKGMFPSLKNPVIYRYDDVIDFELLEDGSSVVRGGIGRAVVGGVLFGGVGAIVGATTGKKVVKQSCTSLIIKITVNNMSAPAEYIRLITSPINKNSVLYRSVYQEAQRIISLLQLICNQRNTQSINHNQTEQSSSAVDEIRRYKALLDDGIITEEEFLHKKKQLLGMQPHKYTILPMYCLCLRSKPIFIPKLHTGQPESICIFLSRRESKI